VGSVVEDGPAAKAGIVQGDVILKINGVTVEDSTKLIKVVGALPIGSEVPLIVWRRLKGKNTSEEVTLKIKIGEFKDQEEELKDVVKKDAKGPDAGVEISGLTLQELTPKLRQRYQLGELVSGLLIAKVDPESAAYDSFKPGDVLLEIDQQKVVSHREAKNRIESAKASKQTSVLCLIQRQGNQFFVSLSLEP
jgi:serine protease Do